jgi:hypothetical protein
LEGKSSLLKLIFPLGIVPNSGELETAFMSEIQTPALVSAVVNEMMVQWNSATVVTL